VSPVDGTSTASAELQQQYATALDGAASACGVPAELVR
jgi:hypothetical protein